MIVVSLGNNPQPYEFSCTLQIALIMPPTLGGFDPGIVTPTAGCPGATTTGPTTTVRHTGFGGQPIPKNPTLPRLRSRCLIGVQAAASLPSNLRSKSGVANVISPR